MTLHDAGIALLHPHLPNYVLSGKTPTLTGNAHPNISPYDKYPTATVDVFLAVGNDRTFRRLCEALAAPELAADPRFRSNADRVNNRPDLTRELLPLLQNEDGEALCQRLLALGVPAGPVRDIAAVWKNDHTAHREMAAEHDGYRGWGLPIKFSRTPGRIGRRPPRFGEHGREILESAGLSRSEIDSRIEDGVVLEARRR
jgi:formyl-CoA transferase